MILTIDTAIPLTTGDKAMLALLLGAPAASGDAPAQPVQARPVWKPSDAAVQNVLAAFHVHRNASLAARIASTVDTVRQNLPAPLSLTDEAIRAVFEDAFINREPGTDQEGIHDVLSRLGTMARDEEEEHQAAKARAKARATASTPA